MKFKVRHIKIGICILIFLSLLAVSNRLLLPVYNHMGQQIQRTMQNVTSAFKDRTGLEISYKSLSPSILSGININGIVAVDAESGEQVASIGRLSLGYGLKALLSKDFQASLKSLVLRDVEIRIVHVQNDYWLERLAANKKEEGEKESAQKIDGDFVRDFLEGLNIDGAAINFASDLRVYRLRILYKDDEKNLSCEADLSKAFLSANGLNKIDASLTGAFNASAFGQKFSGSLDFSSVIPRDIDGSSAVLRLSDIAAGDYRVRYVGFLAEYRKRKFSFKMLPSVRNIYAEASADFESGDISSSVFADGFNLGNLAQTSRSDKVTKSLFALNFSVNAAAVYNYKSGAFGYRSNGDIFVPGSVIPAKKFQNDTLVSYSLSGDEKKIEIPYFKTSGDRYNLSFEGAFDFLSLQPSGTLGIESFVFPNGGELSTEIFIDRLERGFMCFAPQIFLDQNVFTAAQLTVLPSDDSWDWTFEVSDYSHENDPGSISIFGSYSQQTKAAQASLSFNTIYLDSIVKTSAFFAEESFKPLLTAGSVQGIGATSLIILVGGALDFINQIKTHMLAKQYESFLQQ